MQLPGANAGKPDVGAAAKDAAKKTPFGFMNMGDLAFDLPGSNVSKDDLPNNVKPSEAKGLPKGPTAKPPSGPSLPKVCNSHPWAKIVCALPSRPCRLENASVAINSLKDSLQLKSCFIYFCTAQLSNLVGWKQVITLHLCRHDA